MAFSARQITLVANTATPLLVAPTSGSPTGTQFINIVGSVTDPLPVMFQITTGTVFWGGPDVSATKGMILTADVPIAINRYGASDIPYVFSTGTPVVTVVCGRQ